MTNYLANSLFIVSSVYALGFLAFREVEPLMGLVERLRKEQPGRLWRNDTSPQPWQVFIHGHLTLLSFHL